MARRKSSSVKRLKGAARKSVSRPVWKGSISFGLVTIPVALYPADASGQLDFDLLDRRDFSPVRYRRVNEKTGREVPWSEIVKGYEYEKGEYVALGRRDFQSANVEATQTIAITDFVDGAEISPLYYDKPYYLAPLKNGERAYSLLREVMAKTGKAGIAKVVIRARQRLAAVLVRGSVLVLNLLRFADELRDTRQLDLPQTRSKSLSRRERNMAEQLLQAMTGDWKPQKYRDDYREDLLRLIDRKIKAGRARVVEPAAKKTAGRQSKVVDIVPLLKRSVEQAKQKKPARRRKAG